MRLLICLSALLALSTGLPCHGGSGAPAPAASDLSARVHFVGTAQIAADPVAAKLNQIGALPETAQMREEAFKKLATTPFRRFKDRIPNTADAHAALLRPLLDDLLRAEWYLEFQGAGNPPPQFALAIRLDNKQSGIWQANLASVLASWTGIATQKIQEEGYDGWELQKHDVPNRIRFIRAGDWAVLGWGQDEPRLQSALLKRIKASKRPVDAAKDYWLDATVDFAGEAATRAMLGPFKPAQMHLVIQGRQDFVRPQITVRFAGPLNLALDRWLVPSNTIHSPIISFTAARGLAPLLNAWQSAHQINAPGVPNQLFIWAGEQIPFETCLAAPVAQASNYLGKIQSRLLPVINSGLAGYNVKLQAEWATNEIRMKGLPIVIPYIRSEHEPAGDYLMAGLLPSPHRTAPMPPQLINELSGASNLVYYDWEATESRLKQWKVLNQLRYISQMVMLPETNTPPQKWLESVRPKLATSATRITLTAPNELTFVRNSALGLTAGELTLLVDWIEADGFPFNNHHEPPPSMRGGGAAPRR